MTLVAPSGKGSVAGEDLGVPGSGEHELMALAEDLEAAAARDEDEGDEGEDEDGDEE